MRPEHAPIGDPCLHVFETDGRLCGRPARAHRQRERPGRRDYHRPGRSRSYRPAVPAALQECWGVDGEGQGEKPHRYTFLAARNEGGTEFECVRNPAGLSTRECLDFLLSLREEHGARRVFGFALGYDFTKILVDLPDQKLYELCRPQLRKDEEGRHRSVFWGGYRLNYLRGRLAIQRVEWDPIIRRSAKKGPSIVVWDVFRFFACKFTTALIDWRIGDKAKLEFIARMKDKRADFDTIDPKKVEEYCGEECLHLAQLVRQVIDAHESIGLRLRNFYGAGSSAAALLTKLGVKQKIVPPPEAMRIPLACGFFGGRFEVSRIGPISGPVYNYDISSAYPYQTCFLPCLTCGRWELVTAKADLRGRIERARLALVQVKPRQTKLDAWGPFPWRDAQGMIRFPLSSGGVYVWKDEALAGERLFPNVELRSAWVYDTDCDCRPFAEIPKLYLERLRIGKEGPGIILKLAMNSVYGKLAQSVGSATFNSWVYAGTITSGCRAQLLECFSRVSDRWDILMFATDGIWSRIRLDMPKAKDTGTDIDVIEQGSGKVVRKPLGGWEEKILDRGAFLLRPGIYFPLEPTPDDIKEVKARGISKSVLLEAADDIVRHWNEVGWTKPYVIGKEYRRFVGMKSGVHAGPGGKPVRSADYGEWVKYPIEASFNPLPKRVSINKTDFRLLPWLEVEGQSNPYSKAKSDNSPEAVAIKTVEMYAAEQPDGEFVEG